MKRWLLLGIGLLFLQGCGESGSENHAIIVEFTEQESKAETATLWVYLIAAGGDGATCQNLIDGTNHPDDTNYEVEDKESISYPVTGNIRQLKALKNISILLFFVEGEDANENVTLRGCTEVKTGDTNKVVINLNYLKLAEPAFSPPPGIYATDQEVTISADPEATVYYTTDGSEPTTSSSIYSSPIPVAGQDTTMTIKAMAVKSKMQNSNVVSGTFTIKYTGPYCGDGIKDPNEACDDGNDVTETSCPYGTPTCSACNADCSAVLNLTGPYCGDGIKDPNEACDDGNNVTETACPYGTKTCTACNSNCSAILNLTGHYCGDGIKDSNEACDDGNNVTETSCPYGTPTCSACNADCSAVLNLAGHYCGDGVKDPNEVCDDGNNVTETACPYGTKTCIACNSNCSAVLNLTGSNCGDGIKDANEVCDDGNNVTEISCPYGSSTCTRCNANCTAILNLTGPYCGDNLVTNGEACDDGNAVTETACPYGTKTCTACNANCTAILNLTGPYCGDGTKDPNEACDDGNNVTETSCPYGSSTCTRCNANCTAILNLTGPYCGDNLVTNGEACDDGNTVTETACPYGTPTCTRCNANCTVILYLTGPYCGDGIINGTETCENNTQCSVATPTCSLCECIRSGTATINGTSSTGYDFSAGTAGSAGDTGYGDFYFLVQAGVAKFWANNPPMQGLVDVGVTSADPLQNVPIPTSGYNTRGVTVVVAHTYVSKAVSTEPNYYIIFSVTSLDGSNNVTFNYVYVTR